MSSRRSRRRLEAAVLAVFAVALVALAIAWLSGEWRDPRRIDQDALYVIGTSSSKVAIGPIVRPHTVVIARVTPTQMVDAAAAYVVPAAGAVDAHVQGYYEPASREIHITGVIPRLQASFEVPILQWQLRRALRHEYGHALLDDWTRTEAPETLWSSAYSQSQREADPADVAAQLRPLVLEYRALPSNAFGAAYFTSTFNEYFAEGYARYLEGADVPPELSRFLNGLRQR